MPDLVGMPRDKIEALQVHPRLGDLPDTCRSLDGFVERLGQIEFKQAVHAAKGVNRVQLATGDPDFLTCRVPQVP